MQRSVQELTSLPARVELWQHRFEPLHSSAGAHRRKAHQATFCKLCARENRHEHYREVSSEKVPVKKNLEIVGVRSPHSTRGVMP